MESFDVIIVGAGMVGASLANLCAAQGLKVGVIESFIPDKVSNSEEPRMRISAISMGSQNLLENIGVWHNIVETRACPYRRLDTWETKSNPLKFSSNEVGASHLGHIIENDIIQTELISLFEKNDVSLIKVDVNQGETIQSIEYTDRYALIKLGKSSSEFRNLETKLLVAADGGQSRIRSMSDIGVTGWNYAQQCFAINIKTSFPQQDVTWQEFHPSGPRAFLPLYDNYASLIWYDGKDKVSSLKLLSNEKLKAVIQDEFPELPGDFEVLQTAAFPLTRQHANSYVKPRLALIGDAAHTINPLAGQGVNIGFQDVESIARVLIQTHKEGGDIGELAVLKQYENERYPKNLLMMSAMDLFYTAFSNDIKPIKLLRNIGLNVAQKATFAKSKVLKYAMGLG